MNVIVLVKQVPDVTNIPDNAWDRERGTLKRAALQSVFNPLDIQALTFARHLGADARVVCLTMGPAQARDVLEEAVARGADEGILLTDIRFSGADTPATAYALAQAVRRISREIFHDEPYVIVSGMQSVDGDTAQVPPQVAEELGIEHIAYACGIDVFPGGKWQVKRIGPEGRETVEPLVLPVLVTVTDAFDPLNRSWERTRMARQGRIRVWDAGYVHASPERIGLKGSRTWVTRIFSTSTHREHPCTYEKDMDILLDRLEQEFKREAVVETRGLSRYVLSGKAPTYHGELWVYAEILGGRAVPVVFELLAKARELAGPLKEKVAAVCLGDGIARCIPELFTAGADKVYLADDPVLKDFCPFPYKKVIAHMAGMYRPQIFLFGATPLGRELAPRVAYAVGAGLTADCTALEIADHQQGGVAYVAALEQTRPALGGNIMASILSKNAWLQMATVRPGVFRGFTMMPGHTGEIVRVVPEISSGDMRIRVAAREKIPDKIDLQAAGVIIAGGRGMGSRDQFDAQLKPLADALASWLNVPVELGASRMAVEDGLAGHERQVGQTGQTVAPGLYVAVGISGAVQHVAGMQGSRIVLAINQDPSARIYHYADYGLVGRHEDIIPRLVTAIRRRCA